MIERDFTRLANELTAGRRPGDVSLADVCCSVRRIVGVSAASLLVVSGSARGVVASSDATAQALEEAQVLLGEGPSIDAVLRGRPVLVSDVAAEKRTWFQFVPRALEDGMAAIFAFPMPLGLVPLGVLTFYRHVRGPLTTEQRRLALGVTDAITEIMLADEDRDWTRRRGTPRALQEHQDGPSPTPRWGRPS